jgi:hypothetical protein
MKGRGNWTRERRGDRFAMTRRRFLGGAGSALAGMVTVPGAFIAPSAAAGQSAANPVSWPGGAQAARRADDFVEAIGVNTHLRYLNTPYASYTQIVKPRLLEAGIRYIRDGSDLSDTEFLGKVSDLARSGIRSDLIMQPPTVLPANAVQMVTQLGDAVVSIEGPNEPDNQEFTYGGSTIDPSTGNFEAAILYQQDLYQAMKTNPTTARIPVLVFSLGDPFAYGADIGNISQWLDFGNMHSYSGGQEPTGSTNSLQDYIVAEQVLSGTKPLMASETGYYTAPAATDSWQSGISLEAQGKYIPRVYLEYFNAGVLRTWIYEFMDEGVSTTASELNYGMITATGAPKPAYTAVSNLIHLLEEQPRLPFLPQPLNYQLSGDTSNLHQTLLQKQTGAFYLLLWLAVSSYDTTTKTDLETSTPITVEIQERFTRANLYDPLQSASPIQTFAQTGTINVQVPDHALVLELIR